MRYSSFETISMCWNLVFAYYLPVCLHQPNNEQPWIFNLQKRKCVCSVLVSPRVNVKWTGEIFVWRDLKSAFVLEQEYKFIGIYWHCGCTWPTLNGCCSRLATPSLFKKQSSILQKRSVLQRLKKELENRVKEVGRKSDPLKQSCTVSGKKQKWRGHK